MASAQGNPTSPGTGEVASLSEPERALSGGTRVDAFDGYSVAGLRMTSFSRVGWACGLSAWSSHEAHPHPPDRPALGGIPAGRADGAGGGAAHGRRHPGGLPEHRHAAG